MNLFKSTFVMAASAMLLSGCFPFGPECYEEDDIDKPSNDYPQSGGFGNSNSPVRCSKPSDCHQNETCGIDGFCHPGDCYFWQCTDGYTCERNDTGYVCVPDTGIAGQGGAYGGQGGSQADGGQGGSQAGSGGQPDPQGGAGGNEDVPVNCGNPTDCASGQYCSAKGVCTNGSCVPNDCVNGYECIDSICVLKNPNACMVDADCVHLGSDFKCVSGQCRPPAEQCTDKTQCPDPKNQRCVEGKCIAACAADTDCPDGFKCDVELGICSLSSSSCVITKDCNDEQKVCVAGTCVNKCGDGNKCDNGFVCVANGCVPDASPKFTCIKEGEQDACKKGSICLHHSCYITCTMEPDSCAANPADLNQCKTVVTATSDYHVCGSPSNLGNQCDPTAGKNCKAGKVCIDGFCR